MAKEIHEQPEVISHTLANYIDMAEATVTLPDLGIDPARICRAPPCRPAAPPTTPASSASTGSSAMRACRSRSTSPPRCATASRRCRKGGLSLFVSQSGETADTLAVLRHAKAEAQRIAAVVNVRTSSIARESDIVLPTLAGPEIGVASTKAFTCQLSVLACLALGLAARAGPLTARRSASWCRR